MIDTGVTCNLYINFQITKSASTCRYACHRVYLSHSLLLGYVIQKNQWWQNDGLKQQMKNVLRISNLAWRDHYKYVNSWVFLIGYPE